MEGTGQEGQQQPAGKYQWHLLYCPPNLINTTIDEHNRLSRDTAGGPGARAPGLWLLMPPRPGWLPCSHPAGPV